MPPSCPHGHQPDTSFLRLMFVGEILRADATRLALLADVLQQTGLVQLSEKPAVLPVRRQKGTRPKLQRSHADGS